MLATLLRPQAGTLTVLGCSLPQERDKVRPQLSLVGHTCFLYPALTLEENFRFYAVLYGVAPTLSPLVDQFGLQAHLRKPVYALSRGLMQRASLVRALLHQPRLLLLDEPFTALDPGGVGVLMDALLAWKRDGGSAVLTSHDLDRDMGICDTALHLAAGLAALPIA